MTKTREVLLAITATLVLSVGITSLVGNTVEGYFIEKEDDTELSSEMTKVINAESSDEMLGEELFKLQEVIKLAMKK